MEFLQAIISVDAKRPITKAALDRVDPAKFSELADRRELKTKFRAVMKEIAPEMKADFDPGKILKNIGISAKKC